MGVVKDSQREFLDSLMASPAWADFVRVISEQMVTVISEPTLENPLGIKPTCAGIKEVEFLNWNHVVAGMYNYLSPSTSWVLYKLDMDEVDLKGDGIKISTDGVVYYSNMTMPKGQPFYIKFTESRPNFSDFSLTQVKFTNQNVVQKDLANNIFSFGVESVSAILHTRLLSSSPLALKDALDKAGIKHKIDYSFSKQMGNTTVITKGIREVVIREAIVYIQEISGLYRYLSRVELIPMDDFVYYNGRIYQVISRNNKNVGLLEDGGGPVHLAVHTDSETKIKYVTLASGKQVILRMGGSAAHEMVRYNYIVPVSDEVLTNDLSLIVDDSNKYALATNILARVKPARAVESINGAPSIPTINDTMIITDKL